MGERFGNYEIIRKLAAGGMAEVLLAKQRSLGGFERLVCLKRILSHLSAQEDFLKMFQDEARIAANLIHPNIAQIYDISQEGDDYFIAMEYVRGEDLRRVYNQEVNQGTAIPQHIAAQVMMGAAAGLDYAHRHSALNGQPLGIVHRDVSPQNILVTYDGYVKLIDFGVAKAAGKLIETRSGVLKGKYSYMSPEQASGDPVDGRTDVFAMGITLYEITCGARLFKRENELETLHAVIACNVTKPSDIVPSYDRALEAIVLKALAYDPDDRFATAGEMERALERYLIQGGFPTSAANLAEYMHNLFAEKLADEALFGGPPWSEPATSSRRVASKKAVAPKQPELPEKTVVDEQVVGKKSLDDWATEDEALEQTASNLHIDSVREPEVPPLPAEPPPETAPVAFPVARHTVTERRQPNAPKRGWMLRIALAAAVLLALGIYWAQRGRHPAVHPPEVPQAREAQAPTDPMEGPVDPQDSHAYLSVLAPIPLEITLGNRYLGDTPLKRLPMAPGNYRLKLESKREGLLIRRNVRLEAGTQASVRVTEQKGGLSITGKPWAWVQLGLQPPQETPLRLDLLEGEYSLVFECPDGRRRSELVRVTAGSTASAGINCERR